MLALRTIEVIPPKEAGTLLFDHMTGGETLGQPFEFHLDLLSKNGDIPIPSVLGKSFSVMVSRGSQLPRWFNGIVSRFALAGWTGEHFRYETTLRPLLWLLGHTSNCKVFQNTTVPDLVMKIFSANGITAKKQLGRSSYQSWEYLVQYNETDFNFVSRLMEREGISYYFTHEQDKHTLVLIDSLTVHDEVKGYATIPFSMATEHASDMSVLEHINELSSSLEIEPGTYTAKEFDFEKPRAPLLSTTSSPNPHDHAQAELFEYPGHYLDTAERDDYTKRRLGEQQLDYEQIRGSGDSAGITPGFRFALTDHPSSSQNRAYLVTGASYTLTSNLHVTGGDDTGPDFLCSFSAIDNKRAYYVPVTTPKPIVPGPQTAIVVGPKGEEIWTDKYGRVKVQFHWDRVGQKDEKSSCWVRVSQLWAGPKWGGIHIPRIGQEVIVDFLEGDPDRPIVTGRVYNGDNMPPYDLTANQTQSGIKSRSTKGGGPSNFNELRFEDKKGSEHVYLQAEKDLQIYVKNDESRLVDHDRTKHVKNDETTNVDHDRTETVGNNETISIKGNRTETVTKDESITISGGRTENVTKDESVTISGNRTLSVAKNDSTSVSGNQDLSVTKNQTVSVDGARTLSISKDDTISVNGKRSVSIGKDESIEIGKKLNISVADEITIVTGDASINMKKNGDITIKGKNITLDGSGKINVKASGDVIIKGSKVTQN
jgi:type VI secretion system secreted protein VgrG